MSRILVVDDEEVVRDLAVEILRRGGYRPHGVASATLALEALEQQSFDLVLSDVSMPKMTGIELLDELRARRHELPVVLMTGGSKEPELTAIATSGGATGLLRKPFSQTELRTAVAAALGS